MELQKSRLEVVSAITTGDVPCEYFGVVGGREDFSFDKGWLGCLDATSFIPTGKLHVNRAEYCVVPVCEIR